MSSTRKSSVYIMASTFVSKGIAFVGSILIARLLFPEDFGYIVFAEVISGFILLAGNCGFELFYQQEKIRDADHEFMVLNVTYQLRLLFSAVLFVLQIGVSFGVEYFFHEVIVSSILRVLALGHLLNGITVGRQYILRKKLDFRAESTGNILRDGVGTLFKVMFAFLGFGAVSIAMGAMCGNIIRTLHLLRACRFVPQFGLWDRAILGQVWHFGVYSLLSNIVSYFCNYTDKLLLTATFPKASIGLYSFGSSRATMIKDYTTNPLGSLVIAWIAKNKERPDVLLNKIAKMTYLEISTILPLSLLLFIHGDFIIPFVFGSHWTGSVPYFQAFLVLGLAQSFTGNITSILTGMGFLKVQFAFSIAFFVVLIVVLGIASTIGNLLYYSCAFVVVGAFFDLVKSSICAKKLGSDLITYFRIIGSGNVLIWSVIYISIIIAIKLTIKDQLLSFITSLLAVILAFCYKQLFANRSKTLEILQLISPRLGEKFISITMAMKF